MAERVGSKAKKPVRRAAARKATPRAMPKAAVVTRAKSKAPRGAAAEGARRTKAEAPGTRRRSARSSPESAESSGLSRRGTATKRREAGLPKTVPPLERSLRAGDAPVLPPAPPPVGLTEEEQIESAKYQTGRSPRLFEEERFIFPESYGVNRIRLLVKDPEWLFVHWDMDPHSVDELRAEVGERAIAVSKITLRIADPGNGGASVVLLPPGVRSWYVRADSTRRAYRAELGLTLPSGEFRCLAESNTVVTPRVGPSSERAPRVLLYSQAQMIPRDAGLAVGAEEVRSASRTAAPWSPAEGRQASGGPGDGSAEGKRSLGGASDSFRPGR